MKTVPDTLEPSSVENVQHTPGPWQKVKQSIICDQDFREVAECFWRNELPDGEVEANARLIAAAPDLLNMLQRMVDETSDTVSRPCLLTLEHARAALAKAKGVQS